VSLNRIYCEFPCRSGLSKYLSSQLIGLKSLESWQTNVIIATATTFVTEVLNLQVEKNCTTHHHN
jgi:hypothetical protein